MPDRKNHKTGKPTPAKQRTTKPAPVQRYRCLILCAALAFLLTVYLVTAMYRPEQLATVFGFMAPVLGYIVGAAMGVGLPDRMGNKTQ